MIMDDETRLRFLHAQWDHADDVIREIAFEALVEARNDIGKATGVFYDDRRITQRLSIAIGLLTGAIDPD
jgi:hypothetical protein